MMCFLVIWRKDSEILLRMKRGAVVEDFFSPGIRTHITQLKWWYRHWKSVTIYISSPAIEIFLSPKSSGCWILSNAFFTSLRMSVSFLSTYSICILLQSLLNLKASLHFWDDSSSKNILTKQCQCTKSFRLLHLPSEGRLVYRGL